jgi:hypothetical protein
MLAGLAYQAKEADCSGEVGKHFKVIVLMASTEGIERPKEGYLNNLGKRL